jgi:hypothetical protein
VVFFGLLIVQITLMKPMGVVFEENDPSTGGVFVASLAPGGAAEKQGQLRVGDQLVAVDKEVRLKKCWWWWPVEKDMVVVLNDLGGLSPEKNCSPRQEKIFFLPTAPTFVCLELKSPFLSFSFARRC